MLRILAAVLLLALTPVRAIGAESDGTKPVRLVFWNLEWFPGGRPQATTTEAAAQIVSAVPAMATLAPDIVGVTEILNEDAMRIAFFQTPGVTPQVCSVFLDEDSKATLQQIGIGSRLPAIGAWWENWKQARVTPKRGFSFAAFEVEPGKVLLVYSVHLKSNRGDAAENFAMREESTRQLLSHAAAMEKAYSRMGTVGIVMGGDFNTSLDDPRFSAETTLRDLVKAGYQWCWEGVPFEDRVTLPTQPSNNPAFPPFPDTCFDHAFTKNLELVSAGAPAIEPSPSDHRPVVVEVRFPATNPSE
jgi:hypothetical protein